LIGSLRLDYGNKKTRTDIIISIRGFPCLSSRLSGLPLTSEVLPFAQAGILTFPPSQWPSHPFKSGQWQTNSEKVPFLFVPGLYPSNTGYNPGLLGQDHSGGPVPESRGVPIYVQFEHLNNVWTKQLW